MMFSLTFLIERTWSNRKRNICSLQIYHNSSSNAIWRGHEGWSLTVQLIIQIILKPELAIMANFAWKLTLKVQRRCLTSVVLFPVEMTEVQILVSGDLYIC
ncbi:hypothetical protein E2542_SST09168 [Spatholobus suberectus]|nr:hypothetical protein E2542_SST09168 [Spatholobus suberectus]